MIDLVCLVADKNMEAVTEAVLGRHQALGIRPITSEIITHPGHDPGCFRDAASLVRLYAGYASHALVVLDRDWDGVPDLPSVELENDLDARLSFLGTGWVKSIVIDPELEVWLFRRSPRLDEALGWRGQQPSLQEQLAAKSLWPVDAPKPHDPKRAIKWALSRVGKQTSSSIYRVIATQVGLRECTDPSFRRFQATLQAWFPQP
ncbi:MAG: hypothetical protein Q7T30_01670 [Planctomycetota bacterium]|nr:hypothetical protein [Planctomycetota bacterium]